MNKRFITLMTGMILTGSAFLSSVMAAELRVNGSTTVNAAVFDAHKADIEKESGLTLKIVANGSSHGLEDLLKGNADIAMISSSLDSEKSKLKEAGADNLKEFPIGTSSIAFITHKDTKVDSLTSDQVKGILNGEITNWSAVGGSDAPITIISEVDGGGIRSTVEKKLLNGPIKANVKSMPNGPQVVKVVSQLPNSFGIATSGTADTSVKTLKTDNPIQQPLAFVTKGDPSADAIKLIDAVKKLGLK